MTTRQDARERLVALLAGEAAFNVVNGFCPLDLAGATNVLNIYSTHTHHEFLSHTNNDHFYTFVLEFLAKRDNTATAEDALDEAAETIRSVIRGNVDDIWDNIELETNSEAYYALVAGVPYRGEKTLVTVKITGVT